MPDDSVSQEYSDLSPALGGKLSGFTGHEPGLGGSRRVKADPRVLKTLLEDWSENWQPTVNQILDSGHGRIYALELVSVIASQQTRRSDTKGYTNAQRIAAARALRSFGADVGMQALADALNDRAWWVGQYAADALIAIGAQAIPSVLAALEHPEPVARRRAALILGHIADPRVVEPLLDVLQHDRIDWVRACAARGLGAAGLRTEQIIGALRNARDFDVMLVRQYAGESLVLLNAD